MLPLPLPLPPHLPSSLDFAHADCLPRLDAVRIHAGPASTTLGSVSTIVLGFQDPTASAWHGWGDGDRRRPLFLAAFPLRFGPCLSLSHPSLWELPFKCSNVDSFHDFFAVCDPFKCSNVDFFHDFLLYVRFGGVDLGQFRTKRARQGVACSVGLDLESTVIETKVF